MLYGSPRPGAGFFMLAADKRVQMLDGIVAKFDY
jgi:hypothetical protein